MDLLQFSLFFVALLVGYVLVHLRLARFEEHMQKLAGIRTLDERLRILAESFEKLRLDKLEQQLERLHDDLVDLREATTDVRQAVYEIPQPTVVHAAAVEAAGVAPIVESPGARVLALVETRLVQLGYGKIQVLTDLSEVRAEREVEVHVECERAGMSTKGRVVVRNGAVRDVILQNVATMFP
ncbi:MAG: hypothetical protein H6838_17395 [Planctomycetes bacterium]|nr:hypothetical protein [Planctomycetota bacterium]